MKTDSQQQPPTSSFWKHLEDLRWMFIRILLVIVVVFGFVFIKYDFLFTNIILSPTDSDFVTYRCLKYLLALFGLGDPVGQFQIHLINYELSGQFMLQISGAFLMAGVISLPYIIFELWRFVRPALFPNESRYLGVLFFFSSFLFYLGALVSYFIIFPLTIHFLGTYQVSDLIANQISVQSYFSALIILVLSIGLTFEMPILAYFLSKMGVISKGTLAAGRRYAFVIILTLAAIITPTTDPFTLMAVAVPLYLLYEVSIWVCKRNEEIEPEGV
jgi:sec-independent protein translocase protein TatC